MQNSCLIDTNLLLYAYTNLDKKKQEIVISLLQKLSKTHTLFISNQTLLEFTNVLNNNLKDVNKSKEILKNITSFCEVISYNTSTIEHALCLSKSKKLNFLNVLLLQTMIDNNIFILYSDILKQKKIDKVKIINPFRKISKK